VVRIFGLAPGEAGERPERPNAREVLDEERIRRLVGLDLLRATHEEHSRQVERALPSADNVRAM